MNPAIILFLNLGGGEIAVIMLFVLLFFGADKVPELARGLGKGIRQFKDAMNGIESEVYKATQEVHKEIDKTITADTTTTPESETKTQHPAPVEGTVSKEQ